MQKQLSDRFMAINENNDRPCEEIAYPQLQASLIITYKRDKPVLEMRRLITNEQDIKLILDAAFYGKPVITYPVFRDKLRAISALIQHKIIEYDSETGKYYYLI